MRRAAFALLVLAAAPALAAPSPIEMAVKDADRPAADTSRDAGRKPAELLAFAGIKPGMVVVDMLPGAGYFTRLFARAVGPKGRVYAYFGTQYDARLKGQGQDPDNQFAALKHTYPNLGVIHGPLEGFVTPQKVDLVWTSDNYHDMHNKAYAMDPAKVNKAVFASLKPGGIYLVMDHRAAKGAGAGVTETLHRMDEDIAKKEIEAAGFRLVAESKILTNPSDDNSKRVFEQGEHDHTDQFVLKFVKPR
ncbi:MAG: class I SAM-dependent methyltransferase [Alphaproteobacteria bacterium]|nr:class I SAM-dependent methyltransferase [Alphaproteobacteria bacterium]